VRAALEAEDVPADFAAIAARCSPDQ